MCSICKGGIYEEFVNSQKISFWEEWAVPSETGRTHGPAPAALTGGAWRAGEGAGPYTLAGRRASCAVALGEHPAGPKKFTCLSARRRVTDWLRMLSPSRQVTMSSSPGQAVMLTCRAVTTRAMWGNFQQSPAE